MSCLPFGYQWDFVWKFTLTSSYKYSYATDEQHKRKKKMKKKRTYGKFMANVCDSITDPSNRSTHTTYIQDTDIAHVSNEILFILPSFYWCCLVIQISRSLCSRHIFFIAISKLQTYRIDVLFFSLANLKICSDLFCFRVFFFVCGKCFFLLFIGVSYSLGLINRNSIFGLGETIKIALFFPIPS